MVVHIDYSGEEGCWYYYYINPSGYKTTTRGFSNHIIAETHATNKLGIDIKIKYN